MTPKCVFSFVRANVQTTPLVPPRLAWPRITEVAPIILSFGSAVYWGNKENSLSWKCPSPCWCLPVFAFSTALAAFPNLLLLCNRCKALWTAVASRNCSAKRKTKPVLPGAYEDCREGFFSQHLCDYKDKEAEKTSATEDLCHCATPWSQQKLKGWSFVLSFLDLGTTSPANLSQLNLLKPEERSMPHCCEVLISLTFSILKYHLYHANVFWRTMPKMDDS